jgi:hypothetical protein
MYFVEVTLQNNTVASVVMSVFNGERFLPEAVESILNQSFRDFEFIVINDGSTDSSGLILDSYQKKDSRLRVYHQKNMGLIESLNRGCSLAQGRYIARMDADDVAVRDRLLWQIDFMEKHPAVGVVGGAVEVISREGKPLATYRNPTGDAEIKAALLHGSPFWHPTVLVRKEVFISVAGYRKAVVEAEDYDLWLRIADRFQLANLDVVLLRYRLHPHQVSVLHRRQQILSSLAARAAALLRKNGNPDPLDSVENITQTVLARLGVSEAAQQTALATDYVWTIRNMCDTGEYSVALDVLSQMLCSPGLKQAGNCTVADFRLLAARIYWHQRRIGRAILNVSLALLLRPIILGRPLKPLLRWLRTDRLQQARS